jgi:tagatose 1,6-diphosphate aldolase
MKVQMSRGKFEGIQACATDEGVIAAAAMDQRGSLQKAIAKARGADASAEDLSAFKTAVVRVLTPYASAILLDPEYGLEALQKRAPNTGLLLAYEKTGYDASVPGRLPDLLDEWSVRRLVEAGANAVKILLYYNPFDDEHINSAKEAFIERVGAECQAVDVPFFLEPLAYDDAVGSEKGLEFARKKPDYVRRYMEEFSKERYGVDVLKVEFPVNVAFVSGMRAFSGGEAAYSREEAVDHLHAAAGAAKKPFIYLSAGVSDDIFRESLELAAAAGVPFCGVLAGRATWQEGIPIYGKEGLNALEAWLEDRAVKNIGLLNEVLSQGAKPWWTVYGGRENIEIA